MSFSNPVKRHAIDPQSFSAECKFCGQKADLYHMAWACQANSALDTAQQPTVEGWEAALSSLTLEDQKTLVKRARAAALANGIPE